MHDNGKCMEGTVTMTETLFCYVACWKWTDFLVTSTVHISEETEERQHCRGQFFVVPTVYARWMHTVWALLDFCKQRFT